MRGYYDRYLIILINCFNILEEVAHSDATYSKLRKQLNQMQDPSISALIDLCIEAEEFADRLYSFLKSRPYQFDRDLGRCIDLKKQASEIRADLTKDLLATKMESISVAV